MPNTVPPEVSDPLYTAPDIAREIGCNNTSVYRALERLGIEPERNTASGIHLYGDDVLAQLRGAIHPGGTSPSDKDTSAS